MFTLRAEGIKETKKTRRTKEHQEEETGRTQKEPERTRRSQKEPDRTRKDQRGQEETANKGKNRGFRRPMTRNMQRRSGPNATRTGSLGTTG